MNVILIPRIGIGGAAFSTLAGHVIYALTVLILANRIISFTIPWRSLMLSLFYAITMGYLLITMKPYLPIIFATILSGMTYLFLCFATNLLGKREWYYLRQIVKKG
jgi:O-antigen/teichoic acid export membrane protein